MRIIAIAVLLLLLAGCDYFDASAKPQRDTVFVQIQLVDDLPMRQYGEARCSGEGVCILKIKRATYPMCIAHEVRHAFEGAFHDDRESTEDCHG